MSIPEGYYNSVRDEEDFDRYVDEPSPVTHEVERQP